MEYRIVPGRLEIGKFSLYYERVGSGPALVFLHGLGGDHLSWWQQAPYFMRSYECITLDQRSFGLSPDPDGLFNRAHASDLGALLDHLKIDKAVLVGQSMGGWTIVGYALEHPERVAGMVLADTPGGIFTPDMKFEFVGPMPIDATPPIGSLPTYAADYFARRPELAFLYDEIRILGARPPADAGAQILGQSYDLAAVRERLRMPVLCMVGEQDTLIRPEIVKSLANALPDARLRTVPDCGHSIYFEQPGAFNQLVRDFMLEIGY
ncbi:MAG: alpha/beta hydrolase [Candidatus Binatus sp.]|uniref:alpha/beta fold hydrolase n=1 Tax=Candidatus Binatus sp. TaxID=2811406 RepID=UPI00271B7C07|nr:alpha/beta hydrolase [Candidatus Binatus sp.]MDO8434237.1 alpha/beta hydrolase [Candidatus Binatus sp.]